MKSKLSYKTQIGILKYSHQERFRYVKIKTIPVENEGLYIIDILGRLDVSSCCHNLSISACVVLLLLNHKEGNRIVVYRLLLV